MGQKSLIIMQMVHYIKDGEATSKKLSGHVVGATFGFYNQWSYGNLLIRDALSLVNNVVLLDKYLKLNGKLEEPEHYSIIRDWQNKTYFDIGNPARKLKGKSETISTKGIHEKLMGIFNAHYDFNEVWNQHYISRPYLERLDVCISKHQEKINNKNLFKYIPMPDLRNNKKCLAFFNKFENDDGGCLISLIGGEGEFIPMFDTKEIRMIDGVAKRGQFVSPDAYIKQYIQDKDKASAKVYKKIWDSYKYILEQAHGMNFVDE